MDIKMLPFSTPSLAHSQLNEDFTEGHTVWKTDNCEVYFTEIHQAMHRIPLNFTQPVFSHIINGYKKIRLKTQDSFSFHKNQTLILPKNSALQVDFPRASPSQPTQCTTIAINPEFLREKTQYINETSPKLDHEWSLGLQGHSIVENAAIHRLFQKITWDLRGKEKTTQDNWEDTQLEQLLLGVMQQQNRLLTADQGKKKPSLIQSLVTFIEENPEKSGNLTQLCNQACMSPSTLYRYFKRELGISPIEFIIEQKLNKAKEILSSPFISIKEVSYLSGFEDSNYFIRLFKKHEGITPKQYQELCAREC
ncbi:helix-turn-helix domain-containing protein [Flavobacterium sp. JP2137]|uniref:helix-turn-helix domain-containing protein n=1 Tax=Flavobacterium sp. JP2137 TaxID=3414510 RepID=UPI003D2FB4C2